MRTPKGEAIEASVVVRVLDRIAADEELSNRLNALDEDSVRSEFLVLYESEAPGKVGAG